MILAVESSCDETALALVNEFGDVVLNYCASQISLHQKFGGVVPELASRSHLDVLDELSQQIAHAKSESKFSPQAVTAIATTMGPGLIGPLLVGSSYARGLASAWNRKLVGVHHLRAHLASVLLDPALEQKFGRITLREKANKIFPAWVLLVSGGHCMLLSADAHLNCTILKTTADDAAGECFDKCAKLLGLPYPGGPSVQKEAAKCVLAPARQLADEWTKKLPRPKSQEGFSFAGLKTAFRLLLEQDPRARENISALCKALEASIVDSLVRVLNVEANTGAAHANFICCGGVAANLRLREELGAWAGHNEINFFTVPLEYATDNAAMVAAAAHIQDADLDEPTVFARGRLE